MNPNTSPLYAGISGLQLEAESFELGQGVTLSKTFAHVMAPFLIAFAPANPGEPHPGPWSAVSGGLGYDIHVQLLVPADFARPQWFSRLNTVWWLVALLRLKASSVAIVPVVSHSPFAKIPTAEQQAKFWPIEVGHHRLLVEDLSTTLSEYDLEWVKKYWIQGGDLMSESDDLNAAFQAFDNSLKGGRPSTSLMMLWGAIEQLFSPAKQELRFRISATLAAFLEPPGVDRLSLHKRIVKLYDERSKVAHGAGDGEYKALADTYTLLKRAFIKIIEDGHVPTRDELDASLFGC